MTIGIDIRTLQDRHYSGVSEYTYQLLSGLKKHHGFLEFRLFYNSFKNIDDRMKRFGNTKGSRYPNKLFNYVLQKFLSYPQLDRYLGNTEVFFAPHLNFMALSKNCQKILTIHDLSFLRYPEFFSHKKNFWHKMVNVKKLVNEFDVIVAVSEHTKKDLMELLHVPIEKIRVIHSGIDEMFFEEAKNINEVKNKYQLPDQYILSLGNIEPRKNLLGILKIYESFRDNNKNFNHQLVIAGAWGWKYQEFKKALNKSVYKNDIKILGYVDRADKPALYNLAAIFLYPSFYEGFGFPPLEAMAQDVPTLVGCVSSLPEICGDGALACDPDDWQSFSNGIESILSDEKLRNKMIEKGKTQAAKFHWDGAVQKYYTLFEQYEKKS